MGADSHGTGQEQVEPSLGEKASCGGCGLTGTGKCSFRDGDSCPQMGGVLLKASHLQPIWQSCFIVLKPQLMPSAYFLV